MIETRNLTFGYKGQDRKVFVHLDLEIAENSIYGLLGQNGAGKTTLLALMNGLYRPIADDLGNVGEVLIDGENVAERQISTLEKIYFLPDEFELPEVSLKKYLGMRSGFYRNFSYEMMQNNLREFGISEGVILNRLSLGQRKKVMISFALATRCKILMMDEPTNGLDIPSKSIFRKMVARCMSEDQTIIISTHLVHDVEGLFDHIIILDDNRCVVNASMADIAEKYTFEYRSLGDMDDSVIYTEPSLQGNATISLNKKCAEESPVNLELFFNAVINKKIK